MIGDTIVVGGVEFEVVWAGGEGLSSIGPTKPNEFWTPPKRIYNKKSDFWKLPRRTAKKSGLDKSFKGVEDGVEKVQLALPFDDRNGSSTAPLGSAVEAEATGAPDEQLPHSAQGGEK